MADNQNEKSLPKATHTGTLEIGDARLPCAVLEGGKRMLTQEGFLRALGRAPKAKGGTGASVDKLPAFMAANNLKPFISEELERSTKPIRFRNPRGVLGYGYSAELLPRVCQVYLEARDENALHSSQLHIAEVADILMRGLAHVGIIALIDEATGYQDIRDRIALQKILEKYVTDEWAKWTKTFPDEFYKEMFRLRNIPYPPTSKNRPSYIGHWTNDIVYSRLVPGALKALREKNPVLLSGHRKRRHHQYLTRDIGDPALREHLTKVIFLMRGCTKWNDFKRRLERASPKYGDTMPLDFEDKD